MKKQLGVNEFLVQLLAISTPLESFDMPLLDAHGATLAEDIYAGDRHVLKKGSRIRSTQIGLAASIGLDHLPTRPHPRVVVISAGDDLVEPGNRLEDSEDEYESNSWMLTTAVKEAGAMGYRVHSIPENHEQLKMVIEDQLVRADLIVISGESQDESFDLITAVLSEMGEITTVIPNIENSGRHNFGKIGPDKTPVITLPGDPIAAYLSAELFVRPMIRTMLGAANIHRTILKATLTHDIESPIGTTSLVRASIVQNGKLTVTALADQETLATLSDAQGLIAIAGDSPGAVKGEIVDVILLERAT
ncbi:MAG: molybdopterin-binding protein [Actinomycetes bacterium]|jgi:molybdopterin biosynthesis enzyme